MSYDYSSELSTIALALKEGIKQNEKLLYELNEIKHELNNISGAIVKLTEKR
jgi:hypothetical protein